MVFYRFLRSDEPFQAVVTNDFNQPKMKRYLDAYPKLFSLVFCVISIFNYFITSQNNEKNYCPLFLTNENQQSKEFKFDRFRLEILRQIQSGQLQVPFI